MVTYGFNMDFRPINKVYEEIDLQREEYKTLFEHFRRIRTLLESFNFSPVWHLSRPWEWATVVLSTNPSPRERILDIGGCRSILPFYLAELGCEVSIIDIVFA